MKRSKITVYHYLFNIHQQEDNTYYEQEQHKTRIVFVGSFDVSLHRNARRLYICMVYRHS